MVFPCFYFRYKKKISTSDSEKIAMIHGTSELHAASDANTFTQELFKVYNDENGEIPILQIARYVIKDDLIEVWVQTDQKK